MRSYGACAVSASNTSCMGPGTPFDASRARPTTTGAATAHTCSGGSDRPGVPHSAHRSAAAVR